MADLDLVRVVQMLRAQVDITQERIALITGLGPSTVSRLEAGKPVHDLAKARRALHRLGALVPHEPTSAGAEPPETAALRRLVAVYDLPDDGPVRPMPALRTAVSEVVGHRLNSRYAQVTSRLPLLIPELTRALERQQGARRYEIARLLVQCYRAADAVADKNGAYDLSARIIQVMLWASEQAEDPCTRAAAQYVRAEVFFASSGFEDGRRMLERAAGGVQPGDSVRAAAAYGALHMRAAVLAARAGAGGRARDHLAETHAVARRVDEAVYDGTAFGPGSVRIHEVTLELGLDSPERALAAAAGWVPSLSIPAERRSHFHIDLARAHLLTDRRESALDALEEAHRIAPEHVRLHPDVRAVLAALARAEGSGSESARTFAHAAGFLAVTAGEGGPEVR
ncbi:helix-turn-helix domain-containing protein [Murinocardiopsis flavida]|uniref:helix-turn-helix domain-containing protein n=1 Tax=Murinocardiopsis flavida TaxID=645275 RepID=UPI001475350A|nr:helix-turn-helix transcriptional regulator [Murinocardiopsis flavida]